MSPISNPNSNPESWSSTDTESEIPARVVVYVTNTLSGSKSLKMIRAILSVSGLTVEQRDALMGSKFASYLDRNLMVKLKDFPIVFIGGRYIGGVNQVKQLKETSQIESLVESLPIVESGVCKDCGGYKFVLDCKDLITCITCSGTGLQREFSTSMLDESLLTQSKEYICLEVEDEMRSVYMIYSVEGRSLATQQTNLPQIKTEASIYGYPSMGCGLYGSKIILAGGELPLLSERYNGIITFDMIDSSVKYKSFPPMNTGKLRPLVFQLNKRLYVFDGECRPIGRSPSEFLSIEYYSPAMKTHWVSRSSCLEIPLNLHDRLVDYAYLVFGNSCLISVPHGDDTVMSHVNYLNDSFVTYSDATLPFTGMATFYSHVDFDDFVMIYFKEGIVRVCKFDFSHFGDSQDLFTVKSGAEDMTGYFADFGKGFFSFTAFDKSCVYVYTFNISRGGTPSGPLELSLWIVSRYVFSSDHFCRKGEKIISVLGCFAPAPNEEAKLRAEQVAATRFRKYKKIDDDYDPFYYEYMESNDVHDPFHDGDEPYCIGNMESWSLEEQPV